MPLAVTNPAEPSDSSRQSPPARLVAVVNMKAGSVLGRTPGEVETLLREAFASTGADLTVDCVEPDTLQEALRRAIDREPDVLIVGGGDGTIRSAAEKLVETGIALGILPLGTLNRLARDLGLPFEIAAAAQALAESTVEEIDVAEVNGRIFLCNSLIGLPITVAEERQRLRGETFSNRVNGYFNLLVKVLASTRRITIDIEEKGDSHRVRALSIAVSNNAYDEQASLMMSRGSLADGELALYLAHHRSGREMVASLLRAMLGLWRHDPSVEEIKAKAITLTWRRPRMRVSNDGELEVLDCPLNYRIRERALKVLMPPERTVLPL